MKQRILIGEWDIFDQVGGGQTVYQNLIRKRPDDTFYYFGPDKPDPARPANAIPIPFRTFYDGVSADIPRRQGHMFYVYRDAMNMAWSLRNAVGEIKLDVVDTPDYRQNGLFLRQALEAHGFEVGTLALALHGTLSSAFRHGWPWTDDPSRSFAELRLREHMQFRVADARYAISEAYAEGLQRYAQYPVNILDPLLVIRDTQPTMSAPENRPADLLFVGRRERRKGPDLFVDIAWWLAPGSYKDLIFIGSDGLNHQGAGSNAVIEAMARRRSLAIEFAGQKSQADLRQLMRQKSVVVVPSRVDQFNLVALEALLDGCPTVISKDAGVARFVEQRLPELSWLLVDLTCDRSAAAPIRSILDDYDRKRQSIVDALQRARLTPDHGSLQRIYEPANQSDRRSRAILHDLGDRFSIYTLREVAPATQSLLTAAANQSSALKHRTAHSLRGARSLVAAAVRHSRGFLRGPRVTSKVLLKVAFNRRLIEQHKLDETAAREVSQLVWVRSVLHNLLHSDERSESDRTRKLEYLSTVISQRRIDRVRYFLDMMRLERLRGNDLIAATYGLRIIRWLGTDEFRLLGFVQDSLRENGYTREAEAAEAMYGNSARSDEACRAFLDDQLRRHREVPDRPFEIFDDRRGGRTRRVSIIVSLYNAADKLPTFWRMLRQQSLVRSDDAEIVLIDSGSPAGEYEAFKQLHARDPLPVVFARSAQRETIQTAWNRGIKLSKGNYLAFLGVDEGVHPDCFAALAQELDKDPSLDWVMADSIVTEVDRAGVFTRDVMPYDRTGYRHDWHYLDCTFLSYVGGLYRRDIHTRFGYYDESFRAAGDTEFKNRVLPFIKSKHVPRPLGVFNNYPEERTTQHPRAEIEDLRAWYLHRTPAGMAYAFGKRPVEDAVALLKDTLGYRKCYCAHTSTDIELANSLAVHLAARADAGQYGSAEKSTRAILGHFRSFERLRNLRETRFPEAAVVADYDAVRRIGNQLAADIGRKAPAGFDVFHDNRYEQHWWSWSR